MSKDSYFPGEVIVSPAALAQNYKALRSRVPQAQIMAVVKANAYGHGLFPTSKVILDLGIRWFGVSKFSEALQLRDFFDKEGVPRDQAHIFTWIAEPNQPWEVALDYDLSISVSSTQVLDQVCEVAANRKKTDPSFAPFKVHLKVDVGMSRAGAIGESYELLVASAAVAEAEGLIVVEGIWSHLSCADDLSEAGLATTEKQIGRFEWAKSVAKKHGLAPSQYHLGATAAALWHPRAHNTLVRCGIGFYGLSPNPLTESAEDIGLTPALHLRSYLTLVKLLPAGESISYGGTWTAKEDHWIGLVPLGYADGIPRLASNPDLGEVASVAVHTTEGVIEVPIVGRICMDQFVVDLGTQPRCAASFGDEVTVIGGESFASADSWARACQTINYEVIAGLSVSIPRRIEDSAKEQ